MTQPLADAIDHTEHLNDRAARPRPWLAARSLAAREWVRFFRQRNRVVGALAQPVIFWLLFGAGLGASFRLPGSVGEGPSYREYFFPGTLVLIVLFTAIFATISIIEDRREGFLQSVLVSPIPRWSMVLGKIAGGAAIAMVEGLIFLLLGLTLDIVMTAGAVAAVIGLMLLVALALTSLGFLIAWRMESTQGFHAIMSVFLLPMWLLSGAFFPAPVITAASGVIDYGVLWLMRLNPLTYAMAAMRRAMYVGAEPLLPGSLPSMSLSLIVTAAFAAATFTAACWIAGKRTTGDLL